MIFLIFLFIIIFIIIFIIFYTSNKYLINEHFMITTWTPYVVDYYNQPGWSNYFYNNGYMYPVY